MTRLNTGNRAGFRGVLAIAEFRVLWCAQAQSRLGDQLARIALSLLVFAATASASLTALSYALTYLPPLLTAPLLPGERYATGLGIVSMTDTLAQVAGFVLGGVTVGFLGGPHIALAVDAATFAVSALLLRLGIRPHRPREEPAPVSPAVGKPAVTGSGTWLIWYDRRVRSLVALIWLFGFFVAPAALAVPYGHQVHGGPVAVGVLMAADPVGAALGALIITRFVPASRRPRLLVPLAVATGIPLLCTAVLPGLVPAVVLWMLSGVLSCYLVPAVGLLGRAVPDTSRARVMGMMSAGLQTTQGAGALLAGSLAVVMPPALVVGLCAAAGSLVAVLVGRWH